MNNKRKTGIKDTDASAQGRQQLESISAALTQAYRSFNSVSDPDIMDQCINEINELRAQRNSVFKELRQNAQNIQ